MDPAPLRRITWRVFLKAHWGAIAATDFFSVEVVIWRGLARYLEHFEIDLKTRRIAIAGMSPSPDGKWVTRLARNLTDPDCGFLMNARFLIHDRDPLFTEAFETTLASSGVRLIKLPARSPNLNAYAERFVRSIKSECLAQVIPFGERQLRHAVKEYAEHYHRERNHRGLGHELIDRHVEDYRGDGAIECRESVGGLLRHYRRAAWAPIEFWHRTPSRASPREPCTLCEPSADVAIAPGGMAAVLGRRVLLSRAGSPQGDAQPEEDQHAHRDPLGREPGQRGSVCQAAYEDDESDDEDREGHFASLIAVPAGRGAP